MIKPFFIWLFCFVAFAQWIKAVEISADNISFKQKPKVSGGFAFNNTLYSGSDSLVKRDPYLYTLCGSLNVDLFGVDLPFRFALSNTSKTYSQPFNRFQIAPKYKWVRLYLGSSAMTFSPYTLAGHDFRGVGVELTPEKWFVGAMYGRFADAVEYDPMMDNIDDVAYKRMGYASKIGWSGDNTDINATFFHAHDDETSLEYHIPVDANLHPQNNTAISAYVRQKFAKQFFVQAEYAFSYLDDRYVDAINGGFGYQSEKWGVSLGYERIAPYYQTLGGYYFTDDREDFTLQPYLKLMGGKLNLSGQFGMERNNLDDMKANDNKRIVGSANATFSDGKAISASVYFSNFSNYTRYKQNAYPYYVDQLDTLDFYQVSRIFNATFAYALGDSVLSQVFSLSGSYQFGNNESGNQSKGKQNVWNGIANYCQTASSLNLNWGLFFSVNHVDLDNPAMKSLYWGPGVNGGWHSKNGSFNTTVSVAYNQNSNDGVRNSSLINSNLGATWSVKNLDEKYGTHQLSATLGLTNWLRSAVKSHSDYEFLATVNYMVSF